MKVRVFYNARAGGGKSAVEADVAAALAAANVEANLVPIQGADVEALVRTARAEGYEAVVAAGGDGTVSFIAQALAGSDLPLGILPLGTLNHFARDLRLPLKLEDAARVIADGSIREVDLGEVNGRYFINNSSIGLYPHIVSKRDRHQQRLGYGKWLAMFVAAMSVFRRYPVLRVVLDVGERAMERTTPFIFVGNNWYQMRLFSLGARSCLDNGELSLYFANRTGRLGLLRLAVRALLGRLDQARDFDSMCLPECRIETRKKTLRVALDGEVTRFAPPLHYKVHAGALRVIAPQG